MPLTIQITTIAVRIFQTWWRFHALSTLSKVSRHDALSRTRPRSLKAEPLRGAIPHVIVRVAIDEYTHLAVDLSRQLTEIGLNLAKVSYDTTSNLRSNFGAVEAQTLPQRCSSPSKRLLCSLHAY